MGQVIGTSILLDSSYSPWSKFCGKPQFITHEEKPFLSPFTFFYHQWIIIWIITSTITIHIYIYTYIYIYIYISIINPYLHHQQSSREVRASPIAVQDSIRDQFRDSRHLKVMREQLTKGERAPFGEGDRCGSMIRLYYGHIYI